MPEPEKDETPGRRLENSAHGGKFPREKASQSNCSCANEACISPSFLGVGPGAGSARGWRIRLIFSLSFLSLSILLSGCGTDAPKSATHAETKPAEPVVPEEIQLAAQSIMGVAPH